MYGKDRRIQNLSDSIVTDIVELFRKEFPNVGDAFSMNNLRNPCYADKVYEAVVNYDGNVFKCTARDFYSENKSGILSNDGNIIWTENINSRRKTKLSRQICRKCRILLLCGGSCSQKAIESNGEEICLEGLDNEDMDRVVMQRFYDCNIE